MVKFSGRKGRALRWLTALAAILLVNFFLNLYPLFPGQALAALDANYATRDMETLQMIRDGAWRVYLRQSPSDFSLSFLKWTILEGWQPWIQGPTISWGDNQLYGFYRLQNDEEMVVYLFGFVADGEEPPTLGISLPGQGNPYREGFQPEEVVTPQPDIPGNGGMFYFSSHRYSISPAGGGGVYIWDQSKWIPCDHQAGGGGL